MMSFVPVPDTSHLFVSIMEFFPAFEGKNAGIYLHTLMDLNWESGKALELPFAHRCETLSIEGHHYLVVSTISKSKMNPDDWSQPGEIHIIDLEFCEYRKWKSTVIDSSIVRNHGMCKTWNNDSETLYLSGEQGIFYLDKEGENWRVNQVFFQEVSEMAFLDLDGDGREELITIEPFHGNTLNIYKKDGANWVQKFSDSLSFGHGLGAGVFKSEPTIVCGNREGSAALEAFVMKDLLRGKVERRVIEEEAGATQTQVFSFERRDYILSANQRKNEVALYT
jgi:hypothetical protein